MLAANEQDWVPVTVQCTAAHQKPVVRTYFQPSTVLQEVQYMSATVCTPVMSSRSSFGPHVTLTLCRRSHAFGMTMLVPLYMPGALSQMRTLQERRLPGDAHSHVAEEVCSAMAPLKCLRAWSDAVVCRKPSAALHMQQTQCSMQDACVTDYARSAHALEMMSSWSATWDLQVLQL